MAAPHLLAVESKALVRIEVAVSPRAWNSSRLFGFGSKAAKTAGGTTALMPNEPLPFGRKRKADKLRAWENQRPKQRATTGHAPRLESRP
jgi:hypothetical protein